MYADYYNTCKHPNSPAMRDANPVVLIYPGVGMFTFAKDKQTARVSAEFYINAINVMKGAEAISEYTALPGRRRLISNTGCWKKPNSSVCEAQALSGRIALVTGSAGGIGKAIAKKFIQEGACVVINDNDAQRLQGAKEDFEESFGRDAFIAEELDVTASHTIQRVYQQAALAFGGVDIVVNCAGISISKTHGRTFGARLRPAVRHSGERSVFCNTMRA
jgi:hypothetical protein